MDDDSTRQSVLFSDLAAKPVIAKFDQDQPYPVGGLCPESAWDRLTF